MTNLTIEPSSTLTTPSTLLSVEALTCIKEERILFENLNFKVNAGDILQIEGPNGAGKTSLLRILAGLSLPYEGEVKYLSQDVIHQISENYYQDLLYMGHLPGVKGELTAQENLAFSLALQGIDPNCAEDTLKQVNLLGFEDSLASHLSAGQHRRIALAKLWQSQARIWILDEPFTAIDKKGVEQLEQRFIEHSKSGGCVILTTHQDLSLCATRVKKLALEYRFF